MPLLIKNVSLFTPEAVGPGSVLVEDGQISEVYRIGEPIPEVESLDLGGAALGPGLIDVHTHGADAVELMDGGDAAAHLARFYVRHGVTGFLPATLTDSFEAIAGAVESVRRAMRAPAGGARVLGIHLEGPFISPQRLGAQSPEYCIPPMVESVERLIEIAGDVARIVALAPEEEGGIEAIERFVERGIIVSLAHTVATAEQALDAFAAGAS